MLPTLLEVPQGFEEIARGEAVERSLPQLAPDRPGFLRCPSGASPWDFIPTLRCAYGILIEGESGPSLPLGEEKDFFRSLQVLVQNNERLLQWQEWMQSSDETLRYRFSVIGAKLRRDRLRALIGEMRSLCRPYAMEDSPSNYDVELLLNVDADSSRLYVRPSFMKDARFDYRVKDVGASIHPVVAAGLARLAHTISDGVVFDPTCGSATLLIERATLSEKAQLIGLDISPTAVSAAEANIAAAGLTSRISVRRGDGTQLQRWPSCDEVLANLPFGFRTRREGADLDRLYKQLLHHMAERLNPSGKAVLFTANRGAMERSLLPLTGQLKTARKLKVLAGGVWCHVFVVERRGPRKAAKARSATP
jgi:23S rRNA G2445 N2-methylase RlmL